MKASGHAAIAATVLLALVQAGPARAVQVAPNVVFIGAGERGAELVLHNAGQTPQEFEVSVLFGYEVSDEGGEVQTLYPEMDDAARSAAGWLRAYPLRGVVPPGQRQTVRLFRRAPAELPEGEYWARLSIQTRPTEMQPRERADGQVQVRVGVTTRQRIPVFVRMGAPSASVKLAQVVPSVEVADGDGGGRSLVARYLCELDGNAAFLGAVRARVEKEGRVLAETTAPLGLFVSGWRRIRVALPESVDPSELAGARFVLEVLRTHPAVQSRHLLPGEGDRWEGPLGLE